MLHFREQSGKGISLNRLSAHDVTPGFHTCTEPCVHPRPSLPKGCVCTRGPHPRKVVCAPAALDPTEPCVYVLCAFSIVFDRGRNRSGRSPHQRNLRQVLTPGLFALLSFISLTTINQLTPHRPGSPQTLLSLLSLTSQTEVIVSCQLDLSVGWGCSSCAPGAGALWFVASHHMVQHS